MTGIYTSVNKYNFIDLEIPLLPRAYASAPASADE